MDFVTCPECRSLVDLKSEIRYSPNRGVEIFHAPCYISKLKRLLHSTQKHIPACFSLGGGMHLTCIAREEPRIQWCVACVLNSEIDAVTDEQA